MPISKTPEVAPFPSSAISQTSSSHRYMTIPTATSMRSRTLFGIPLKSAFTGEEVSNEVLEEYINEAISYIEHVLDLYITPVQFAERHDYNSEIQFWSFGYLRLNHSPILNVNKFELTFNNGSPSVPPLVSIPLEFIHVQPQDGTIQLVPAQGVSVSGFISSMYSGTGFHAFNSQAITQWPGAINVEYTAGFQEGKVPALLVGLIESIAAHAFLSSMGPVMFPVNSVSIGIDGVSQSTGTAGPGFLQGRIAELEKVIQEQMEAAKGYYQKRFLIDYL